jgi:hypothetical protein
MAGSIRKILLAIVAIFSVTHAKTQAQINEVIVQLKTCPAGYVLVPGNSLYKTKDFCVMKYDAKCANASNPTLGIEPAPGDNCSQEGTYKNNGKGCACNAKNNRLVVSTASGFPITFIAMSDDTGDNAKVYCNNASGHLITNDEWMTIARNVEQVPENWCDKNGTNCGFAPGAKGKILANGYNAGKEALVAGPDNEPCFGTTGTNACGEKNSQKRTLELNNGVIIWDFAGNVWQWVDAQVARKDEPKSKSNGVLDTGWTRSDFAPGSLSSVITDNGSLGYDAMRPSDPTWNANNGVGRIYHYSAAEDNNVSLYALIRGGNWRHYSDDGAFTIHLSPPADTENIDDVGFRCVVPL